MNARLRNFFLRTYPIALLASVASIYFFTQPVKLPSIHLGPIAAYLIALIVQLAWWFIGLMGKAWRKSGVAWLVVIVNSIGVVGSATGTIAYVMNGEVYGINIDLFLGPLISCVIAIVLLLLFLVEGIHRRN